jgi:hypothetical protein
MNWTTGRLLVVLMLGVLFVSCRMGMPPRWRYDATGQPKAYKRYARNLAVDYRTRFRRIAYVKVKAPLAENLSAEQRAFISQHGQPEYVRLPFRSRNDDRVEEWLYLSQNRLVQFVHGHVVYEGEVTDVEQTMVRYGYPRRALLLQVEPEIERWTFVYSRPFDREREVFAFANGRLLFRQTQR